MRNKRSLSLFLTFVMLTVLSFAQNARESYLLAEDMLEDENYHKALNIYQQLLTQWPNNANLNFKIGYCYLNTATEKIKAIPYLEFAVSQISETYKYRDADEQNAPLEAYFFLGKAYHVNYRFDDAERTFLLLKSKLTTNDKNFIDEITKELQACQVARQLIKSPVEMTVTNLGAQINSSLSEHSPVISGDESILIFTSKRNENTGGKIMDDGQYFEDIYYSTYSGNKFSAAKKISTNINTDGHEASIGLSFDGTKLFIYRDDNGDGNIYVSEKQGSDWAMPVKLPEVINSKYRETHASISVDQNEIYFTSDRKGGLGGLDIYRVRKLPNGKWSKAQNLGPTINTPYDEEGPYLHPDGTSLFFASKGHNTMGGFDIFVSYIDENDNWSVPQNIGYPINTPDDNVYYIPSVDGRRAYYASYANNSIGNYDIFRIDLSDAHIRNQTVIAGAAVTTDGVKLENAIITVTNLDDDIVGIYTPEPEFGKFLLILPRGKTFWAIIESSNYKTLRFKITVPEFAYDQTKRVFMFNDILDKPLIAQNNEPVAFNSQNVDNKNNSNNYSNQNTDTLKNITKNQSAQKATTKQNINNSTDNTEPQVNTELLADVMVTINDTDSINIELVDKSLISDKNNKSNTTKQNSSNLIVSKKAGYITIIASLSALLILILVLGRKRRGKQQKF